MNRSQYASMLRAAVALALPLAMQVAKPACGQGVPMASSQNAQKVSLGDALQHRGEAPLHILYVHGMGQEGAGDSAVLRKKLCESESLHGCKVPGGELQGREYADQGWFKPNAIAPDLSYLGNSIWANPVEWSAADPFVDHWILAGKNGRTILVDEINWWPLVYAIKCRSMITAEAQLAGTSGDYLDVCSAKTTEHAGTPGRFDSFTWIDPVTAQALKAKPSKAARFNRGIKVSLMDWGFSDAELAVGRMHPLLVESLRQLLMKSIAFSGDGPNSHGPEPEYVVISHSMGSYLMFSALNMSEWQPDTTAMVPDGSQRESAFRYVLQRTSQAYFFANQVPLLELATLDEGSNGPVRPNMAGHLKNWSELRAEYLQSLGDRKPAEKSQPQIVAWSDPSDLLSWWIPQIPGITVVNYPVKNAVHWLGLFEGPISAHDNYARNKMVIQSLLNPRGEK